MGIYFVDIRKFHIVSVRDKHRKFDKKLVTPIFDSPYLWNNTVENVNVFRKYKPLVIKKPSVCKHPEDHHNVLSEVILRDGTFNNSLLTWYVWFMYLAYNQKGTTKYHHYQTNDGYASLQVLIQQDCIFFPLKFLVYRLGTSNRLQMGFWYIPFVDILAYIHGLRFIDYYFEEDSEVIYLNLWCCKS